MNLPIRVGMDTSKSVFQLHGVDENEVVVVRRQFRRAEMIRYFERLPPVLVAIESCGSSHHWARLLQSFGHEVKLIPPQYVKAYATRRHRTGAGGSSRRTDASCRSTALPNMLQSRTPIRRRRTWSGSGSTMTGRLWLLLASGRRSTVIAARSRSRCRGRIRSMVFS